VFSNGWEKIKLKEEAISEIPLTMTWNHLLRLAMLKKILRKKRRNNTATTKTKTKTTTTTAAAASQGRR